MNHISSRTRQNIQYSDNIIQIIIAGREGERKERRNRRIKNKEQKIGWQLAPTYHDCCTKKKDYQILCK
jgi:hypothetical protein